MGLPDTDQQFASCLTDSGGNSSRGKTLKLIADKRWGWRKLYRRNTRCYRQQSMSVRVGLLSRVSARLTAPSDLSSYVSVKRICFSLFKIKRMCILEEQVRQNPASLSEDEFVERSAQGCILLYRSAQSCILLYQSSEWYRY